MPALKSFALAALLLVGCKTDPPAPNDNQSAVKPRSGKVDIGTPHAAEPGEPAPAPAPAPAQATPAPEAPKPGDVYREVDQNNDGTISEDERQSARHRRSEAIHKRLDTNGDGKLTVDELERTPARRIDPASADTNHDGEISVDELDVLMAKRARGGLFGRGRGSGLTKPAP